MQKVFGPKFDQKFPTSRRDAKGGCPSGVWPTTTNDHYHTTGVDLTLGRGQSVSTRPINSCIHEKFENASPRLNPQYLLDRNKLDIHFNALLRSINSVYTLKISWKSNEILVLKALSF